MSIYKLLSSETKNLDGLTDNRFISESGYNNGLFELTRIKEYRTKQEQILANLGWVFKANHFVATSCASVETKLFLKTGGEKVEVTEGEIYDSVFDVLEQPNNLLSAFNLKFLYYTYKNFNGEFYLYCEDFYKGIPLALHLLPPQYVSYKIMSNGNIEIKYGGKELNPDYVFRDINPDPANPYHGMSVIRAGASTIEMEEQAKRFNAGFFANGSRPSIKIEVPEQLSDPQYRKLQQQIEEFHTGSDNAYKPLLLEGGAKASPFALSQREMDFLATRKFNKDEILAMLGVSPADLGMTENVNRANVLARKQQFAENEKYPRVKEYHHFLTKILLKQYPDYVLEGVDVIPEDKEMILKEALAGYNRWDSLNESREYFNKPPVEGGDLIAGQEVEDVEEIVETETEEETDKLLDFLAKRTSREQLKKNLMKTAKL